LKLQKTNVRFGFVVLWEKTSQVGVSFSFYWPSLRGPGRQSNESIVSLKFCSETRLSYESLEPLIDFLAYLELKNYTTKTKKWSKFLPLQKETRG